MVARVLKVDHLCSPGMDIIEVWRCQSEGVMSS
ncbi:hypothetical protein A2U01_0065622, partial [Trifolium medium]|nr:hypothetical protein [Trifolium medium]